MFMPLSTNTKIKSIMDLFSCRICLSSNKLKLCSLFLIKHGQSYAEMVEFSSGIVVIHDYFDSEKKVTNVYYYLDF